MWKEGKSNLTVGEPDKYQFSQVVKSDRCQEARREGTWGGSITAAVIRLVPHRR